MRHHRAFIVVWTGTEAKSWHHRWGCVHYVMVFKVQWKPLGLPPSSIKRMTGWMQKAISCTAWCSEIGSLTSLGTWNSGASCDARDPISLHQAVYYDVCIWLMRLTLICDVTRYRLVQVQQNRSNWKKKKKKKKKADTGLGWSSTGWHIYTSYHWPVQFPLIPSPEKPSKQRQENDPTLFVQVAFPSQLSVFDAHSLISG